VIASQYVLSVSPKAAISVQVPPASAEIQMFPIVTIAANLVPSEDEVIAHHLAPSEQQEIAQVAPES